MMLMVSFSGVAQDSTYYRTAFNSKDDALKLRLHNIIKNHKEYTYTSSSTDTWDILKDTDRDTANPDNVILIYSGRSVNAAQEYNSGSGWTREHVWAKSRGDFGTDEGAGTDVHHLRPCDKSVNSTRNNRNFEDCVTCVDVIDNGFNTGSKRDANVWTFEPPDAVKGDVARMIFYMAVRYEGERDEPDLELTNTLLSNTDKNPLQARLSTLLEWNKLDSVSDWERNRNKVIFEKYQGNKNPFIDYPELAEYLWGNSIGVVWKLDTTTTGIMEARNTEMNLYPNPVKDNLMVNFDNPQKEETTLRLISTTGQVIREWTFNKTGESISISLQNVSTGVYFLEVRSAKLHFSKKVIKE